MVTAFNRTTLAIGFVRHRLNCTPEQFEELIQTKPELQKEVLQLERLLEAVHDNSLLACASRLKEAWLDPIRIEMQELHSPEMCSNCKPEECCEIYSASNS